jgi:hypothetical protein
MAWVLITTNKQEEHNMTLDQFKRAFAMASDDSFEYDGLAFMRDTPFLGFALKDFNPVAVTVRDVAKLIKYQCWFMNGDLDHEALNEIREHGRRKFIILD